MADNENRGIGTDLREGIRREAVGVFAKWTIAGVIALLVAALLGWWFYLQPRIGELVGGVPRGAVLAFDRDDLAPNKCPPGWSPFDEGRARVIVGAGDPSEAPHKMAFDQQGKSLTGYVLRQHGGEQNHVMTEPELPPHSHPFSGKEFPLYGYGDLGKGTLASGHIAVGSAAPIQPPWDFRFTVEGVVEKAGQGAPINTMPPFVALYLCKKL